MVTVYLIRHGEAEGNLYRRMHGHYDAALTDLGWRQIQALGKRFQNVHLDAVYSSDLCRAMHTGAVLCRTHSLPLRTDRRLREVNVGIWEDETFGNMRADWAEEMNRFFTQPLSWRIPGADSFPGLCRRTTDALRDIVAAHPGGTVAVCGHGYMINSILCSLFYGQENYAMTGQSTNTAVSCLTWDGERWTLRYKHDASHLGEGLLNLPKRRDMVIRPMAEDAVEEYIRYRKDAWQVVYGTLQGFDGSGFWLDAQRTLGPDPAAMVVSYLEGGPAGMIQLNPSRDARRGVGYIPFLYLREPFRHQGLGIQLIGHAVSFYRKLGRTKLQLSVAPTNEKALGFYYKYGFTQVKKQRGHFGHLLLLEKDIAPPKPPEDVPIITM